LSRQDQLPRQQVQPQLRSPQGIDEHSVSSARRTVIDMGVTSLDVILPSFRYRILRTLQAESIRILLYVQSAATDKPSRNLRRQVAGFPGKDHSAWNFLRYSNDLPQGDKVWISNRLRHRMGQYPLSNL
jgi:hypothetical protein